MNLTSADCLPLNYSEELITTPTRDARIDIEVIYKESDGEYDLTKEVNRKAFTEKFGSSFYIDFYYVIFIIFRYKNILIQDKKSIKTLWDMR